MDNKLVGISISDGEDTAGYGFGTEHLRDALVEFARYLLINEYDLAYGGHLEKQGYTNYLFDLIRMYSKELSANNPRVKSFLSWPFSLELTAEFQAKYKSDVEFNLINKAKERIGIEGEQDKIALKFQNHFDLLTAADRFHIASSLLDMRVAMNEVIDARLAIGGKLNTFLGFAPGILSEVYLAVRGEIPVFLIGAYGGCSKKIIDLIRGEKVDELSLDYQLANHKGYKLLYDELNKRNKQIKEYVGHDKMVKELQRKGVNGLNNGLTENENEELFETNYLPKMIYLVLKGLKIS